MRSSAGKTGDGDESAKTENVAGRYRFLSGCFSFNGFHLHFHGSQSCSRVSFWHLRIDFYRERSQIGSNWELHPVALALKKKTMESCDADQRQLNWHTASNLALNGS